MAVQIAEVDGVGQRAERRLMRDLEIGFAFELLPPEQTDASGNEARIFDRFYRADPGRTL